MDLLKELNPAQRDAVQSVYGPNMVIAGAGSGKTRVLTYRLAYLISEVGADSFRMLALTFTNKAAKEMKERIQHLVGPEARNIWMGTFHSIFSRLLRREAEKLGYTNSFTIYDSEDSNKLIKRIIKELNLDDKQYKPRVVQNHISSAKNALVDADQYAINFVTDSFTNTISRIYKIYTIRCFQSNAMDFDDLLLKPVELFERYPDVLAKYQEQFKYIMVDEYQDTNQAQYQITKMLGEKHRNICVVGDDAQSIYSFRGANIENILSFKKDYPDCKVYKLEQNYRSTQTIVEAANDIIAKNKNQIQKTVFTENDLGDRIRVLEAQNDQEEGRMIADTIKEQMMRYGYHAKDFVVLYRTNAQSRAVETELRKANLRYKIYGGLSFYMRKEIKDVLAYMKLAINPYDEEALMRVINYPTRGIGKTSIDKLTIFADQAKMKLWDVIDDAQGLGFPSRLASILENFTLKIKRYAVEAKKSAYEATRYIANDSGILKDLHQDKEDIQALARWENVQELLNAAQEFTEDQDREDHSMVTFLQEVSLFTDQDKENEDDDYVTLMTIHMSKGLEFPSVIIAGLEEELFPSFMSLQSRADLEEERRLFYVAVTRARERLTLTHARSRYRFGSLQFNEISRFMSEIDEKFLHHPTQRKMSSRGMPQIRRSTATHGRPAERETPTNSSGRKLTPMNTVRGKRSVTQSDFKGDDLQGLTVGMQVEHEKFGQGKVMGMDGDGPGKKATVFFKAKGQKVLLLKYARLKILS